jgi:UDP-N-acetylmuramate dehydrogenase
MNRPPALRSEQSSSLARALLEKLPEERVRPHAPLAPLTTFQVGGPADWLVDALTADELLDVLRVATAHGAPVTILGGGSNVLVGDRGIRGLVLRFRGRAIDLPRPTIARAEAGVTINGLVRWAINRGLAGLETWAGTPGTVGGAIHGNAHFQGRMIGDFVAGVRLVTRTGRLVDATSADMEFGYDRSRLQRTGEILLWADFRVAPGVPARLREAARESLAFRKDTQPLHLSSAGCIFQNPDPALDALPDGTPASAGALIDRAGLKGCSIGGARVSPVHANFVVNEGGATAADVRALVRHCQAVVRKKFGVALREEIVYLGEFDE